MRSRGISDNLVSIQSEHFSAYDQCEKPLLYDVKGP